MKKLPLFLGGEDVFLTHQYQVVNPATEEVIASVSDAGYKEAMQAIDLAAKSFASWKKTPPAQRADILLRAYTQMHKESDHLARVISMENGKPLKEAEVEVKFSAEYLRWFAEESRRSCGITIPSPNPERRFFTTLEPIGVVGAIVPWNFPANMITRKCAPALAAGCPVVLKPAPETPMTALEIARILRESGLPKGVLSVLPTSQAPEISKAFHDHPAIRMISFTGSTQIGKLLMQQATERVRRVSMELGGNAPVIVFEDARIDWAVEEILTLKFRRVGGESCICANRIFVHSSIYDEFRKKFWHAMEKLKMGPGLEPGMDLGPVITPRAKKRIEDLLEDARKHGGKIHQVPMHHQRGNFVPITLVEEAPDTCRLANEEIFGPIAALYRFDTEEEVVRRANGVPYGLSSYFFTENLSRVYRVGEALQTGFVGINDCKGYVHEIPMGGFKESGVGREGGKEGLTEFLEIKSWNLAIS